ncbi:MAG: Carboxylesterase bioH [Ramlibacter sp.]|nr:Carboxylesterase bioH [Ramlibacter sp.]
MNLATHPLAGDAILRRNGVVVAGQERGKPALVFVNGFGCEQGMWRSVAPQFAPSRRIVLFDHVGTGRAQRAPFDRARYASLQGYADDLLEVCDAADVPDAVLVAHSTGAMIAVLAAIRWPAAFRELILIGPSPCFLNDGSYLGGFEPEDRNALLEAMDANYRHWAHQMAPLIMGHPERPELAWELESGFNRMDLAIARQFARVSFGCDHREDLTLLRTPTVILQCAEDNLVPEVVGEFMRETIPECGLVKLDATGHCPHLSAPEEITRVVRGLLNQGWIETQPAELSSDL